MPRAPESLQSCGYRPSCSPGPGFTQGFGTHSLFCRSLCVRNIHCFPCLVSSCLHLRQLCILSRGTWYGRVKTKEIAGTKKDRGQKFSSFGALSEITQEEGHRWKNPTKLSWPEQSPASTGRRQRKDGGIVNTITTALRTGGEGVQGLQQLWEKFEIQ